MRDMCNVSMVIIIALITYVTYYMFVPTPLPIPIYPNMGINYVVGG